MKHNKNQLHPSVKRIFLIIGGFFFLFFLAIGYTIYIAQKNFEPIMDSRYYEKGLNYEKRKKEFLKAKERNWIADVNILKEETLTKNFNLNIKLQNDQYLKSFFSNENRTVVTLKISYPASIRKYYEFSFKESDFSLNSNSIELNKNISLPSHGNFEFSIEIHPEENATIYYTKKIYVE